MCLCKKNLADTSWNFQSLAEMRVKGLAKYIRTLPPPSNMDALVKQVFGSSEDKRTSAFRQTVQYYLNGTANGFLKYCALPGESNFFYLSAAFLYEYLLDTRCARGCVMGRRLIKLMQ